MRDTELTRPRKSKFKISIYGRVEDDGRGEFGNNKIGNDKIDDNKVTKKKNYKKKYMFKKTVSLITLGFFTFRARIAFIKLM